MIYSTFAEKLKNINCSEETIDALWGDRKITEVIESRRKPNKNSGWEQIEPPSAAHGEAATFWYHAKLNKFWIKLRGG
jgi:hypothetical protein